MGIEPIWDFVEPHTGFEDQERHQVAPHLHAGSWYHLRTSEIGFHRLARLTYWDTF